MTNTIRPGIRAALKDTDHMTRLILLTAVLYAVAVPILYWLDLLPAL